MHKYHSLLTVILLLPPASRLVCQAGRPVVATVDLTVDGKPDGITERSVIRVNAEGAIAVWNAGGDPSIHVISPDGGRRGVVTRARGGLFGWIADSLWTADPASVTVYTPMLSVARVEPFPLLVEGPPGARPKQFSAMLPPFLLYPYPGGDLLLQIDFPLAGAASMGGGLRRLALRTSPDGQFRALAATFESGTDSCLVKVPGASFFILRSYCSLPTTQVSADGRSIVNARGFVSGNDSGRIRVVRTNDRGDTLAARDFRTATVPVSAGEMDSAIALAVATARDHRADPAVVRAIDQASPVAPPKAHQPVSRVLACNDGSVWLEVFSEAPGHHWLILDSAAALVGSTTFPAEVRLQQCDGRITWGLKARPGGEADLLRFVVGGH